MTPVGPAPRLDSGRERRPDSRFTLFAAFQEEA